MAALIVILVMIVLAIAAPAVRLDHPPPAEHRLPEHRVRPRRATRFRPGTAGFWLGTDGTGRDLFIRILYGARISLFVGFVTTAIGTIGGRDASA